VYARFYGLIYIRGAYFPVAVRGGGSADGQTGEGIVPRLGTRFPYVAKYVDEL